MARSDMVMELTLSDAAKMVIAEAKEQLVLNEKQRAVIEAAKALTHEQRHGDPSSVAAAEWAQAKAVDALGATEPASAPPSGSDASDSD